MVKLKIIIFTKLCLHISISQLIFKYWDSTVFWRVIHMTEWRWPNEFDWIMTTRNLNIWTWTKIETDKPLVGVVNFGQIQKLRFVGVKHFRSCSTTTFGHLHSVMLTSLVFWPFCRLLFFNKCQLELHFKSDLRQQEEEMLSLKYKQILQKINFDVGNTKKWECV